MFRKWNAWTTSIIQTLTQQRTIQTSVSVFSRSGNQISDWTTSFKVSSFFCTTLISPIHCPPTLIRTWMNQSSNLMSSNRFLASKLKAASLTLVWCRSMIHPGVKGHDLLKISSRLWWTIQMYNMIFSLGNNNNNNSFTSGSSCV